MRIIHVKDALKSCIYIVFKDLENYMRNHPESRLEKIQEIGKQLIDSNIMTQSIETDVEGLTNRWENLNKQVCNSCYISMFAINIKRMIYTEIKELMLLNCMYVLSISTKCFETLTACNYACGIIMNYSEPLCPKLFRKL